MSTFLRDNDFMPYGKHKGVRMKKVPADYLIWLRDNEKCTPAVLEYIELNIERLTRYC